MAISKDEARGMAAEYGAMAAQRDRIIVACKAADLPISETARLMGVSRKLIYDVLAAAERQQTRNRGIPGLAARLAVETWPASAGAPPLAPVFLPPPCNPAEF